jgi:hypothetical protein
MARYTIAYGPTAARTLQQLHRAARAALNGWEQSLLQQLNNGQLQRQDAKTYDDTFGPGFEGVVQYTVHHSVVTVTVIKVVWAGTD